MENKINIAEILKSCPRGMELDCLLCNNPIELEGVVGDVASYPIKAVSKDGFHHVFTSYGASYNPDDAKCVIFPPGKTTWEGFVPPCKFKDGDIVITTLGNTAIIKESAGVEYFVYCIWIDAHLHTVPATVCVERLATEEEKQKLFDAIKDNGYKWNAETKTLEELITPKFKVGDKVRNKYYKDYIYDIHDITDKGYRAKEIDADSPIIILFGSQENNYELVPNKFDITTLKPFESRVLVRDGDNGTWHPSFWGYYEKCSCYAYDTVRGFYNQCIPYEGNEHLLGTTNDCEEFYKTWEERT